jgi:transposase
MAKPLSVDLRKRIVARWKQGGISVDELADAFMVGRASVSRLVRLQRETGSVEPRGHGGGRPRKIDDAGRAHLRALVEQHPDWTTYELTDAYLAWSSVKVHRSTVLRALHAQGFTRKKSRYLPWSETARGSRGASRNTTAPSDKSKLRVWFLWTRPART